MSPAGPGFRQGFLQLPYGAPRLFLFSSAVGIGFASAVSPDHRAGSVLNQPARFLRFTDIYTSRSAVLLLDQAEECLSVGQLLEKYLLNLPEGPLRDRGAVTPESLDNLKPMQDLVYACDDEGRLTDLYPGINIRQENRSVSLLDLPTEKATRWEGAPISVIDLALDRTGVGYDRNWKGFHRRRWANNSAIFEDFVAATLAEELGAPRADKVLNLDSHEDRLLFIKTLAQRVWQSEFENYSRFVGQRLMFKTGDETIKNIAADAGGICTEKVQALKFLTDHFGLESEYLIGGDGASDPVPETRLREMLQTFDFRFARRHMRYWQHAALLYRIDDVPVLVDATNGNIPFLFLVAEPAERLLGYQDKPSVPVRMVEATEEYFYHRVSQDIPQDLFFALEGWITDTDMVQVFENELGLFLSGQFYVTPLPYRSERDYQRLAGEYHAIAQRAGFRCEVKQSWDFESKLGQEFAASHEKAAANILDARDHLLLRYNEWDLPGHDAGLVVYRLN